MISNLEKYKRDFERLMADGVQLSNAQQAEINMERFRAEAKKMLKEDKKVSEFLEKLPSFKGEYQAWYSEGLILLKQLLPDRVSDFTRLYEKPKASRKHIDCENYVIEDALQGYFITDWEGTEKVGPAAAIPRFTQQINIVKSIERRFESSLFDIKQLVQADVFDSEVDVARELNRKGFTRGGWCRCGGCP
jgi:hypothetical protein